MLLCQKRYHMSDLKSLPALPAASVHAILDVARQPIPRTPAIIDALSQWLSDWMVHAIQRGGAKPLTMQDVNRLDGAYRRFHEVVQELQDRRNPPPKIPCIDLKTDWEFWITTNKAIGFKRGRPESVDWQLIGELIALYEAISPTPASASQENGPTMRFLKRSLQELEKHAPPADGSNFQCPKVGALRPQLKRLRTGYLVFLKHEILELIESSAG